MPKERSNIGVGRHQNAVYFYGVMLYLFTQLVDGPIRFGLRSVNLELFLYLRDFLLIVILTIAFGTSVIRGKFNKLFFIILIILIFYVFVGFVYIANLPQILFGLKIILPFLVGTICYNSIFSNIRRTTRFFYFFLLTACIGLYINFFAKYPWQGLIYNIGNIEIKGGLDSNTLGISRLGGFARTNFEAASQIMLLVIYMVVFARSKGFRIVLWIAAGAAIAMTMTKGIASIYVILSLFFAADAMAPKLHKLYRGLLIVPICVMILLPLMQTKSKIDYSDSLQVILFASFVDRIENGWPPVFENVLEKGNILTGRGVGGTGAGEQYFAAEIKGSPDNMFVYLYAWFGLFSVVLFGLLYWKSQKLNILSRREDICVFLWLASILLYGITANIIESAFFAFFLGLCVAHISRLGGEKRLFASFQMGSTQKGIARSRSMPVRLTLPGLEWYYKDRPE